VTATPSAGRCRRAPLAQVFARFDGVSHENSAGPDQRRRRLRGSGSPACCSPLSISQPAKRPTPARSPPCCRGGAR
jgi:hypothetical protein